MYSSSKYVIFFILIFPFLSVYSDRTSIKPNSDDQPDACQTDFDPNSTLITFYGDSLGDFVDAPLYGYFGWEWYLTTQDPTVNWDIQNLAVGGNRTDGVYELISKCAGSEVKRNNFRTADRIALEIGGNDYIDNTLLLYYAPWKFPDVDARVTHNTRVIVRSLRNSLRNKYILLMGNFPVLSKSPILGEVNKYFKPYKYLPNGQITTKNQEFKDAKLDSQFNEARIALFESLIAGIGEIYNSVVDILSPASGTITESLFTSTPAVKSPTGKDLWYWKHLNDWKESPSSLTSIGVMFHQLSLEKMAHEENTQEHHYTYQEAGKEDVLVPYLTGRVQFIPLYADFSFPADAQSGRFYVANPVLFSDLVHINHIGYYKWAASVTPKIKAMGWHTLPEPSNYGGQSCRTWNCGSAENPPYGDAIVENIAPQPVIVEVNPIDWILLVCLFTGWCW
jgi:lysophospholipase L1-like esterase